MKLFRFTNTFLFILALVVPVLSQSPAVAPVRTVVDEYWGVKVSDPYRYMENLIDPEVQKWTKAQADYTKNCLSKIPGRQALVERLKELDSSKPYRISNIRRQLRGLRSGQGWIRGNRVSFDEPEDGCGSGGNHRPYRRRL